MNVRTVPTAIQWPKAPQVPSPRGFNALVFNFNALVLASYGSLGCCECAYKHCVEPVKTHLRSASNHEGLGA